MMLHHLQWFAVSTLLIIVIFSIIKYYKEKNKVENDWEPLNLITNYKEMLELAKKYKHYLTKEYSMVLEIETNKIEITIGYEKNTRNMDTAYIENVLGLKKGGDFVIAYRPENSYASIVICKRSNVFLGKSVELNEVK
jgi:hypothetical protein